MQNWERFLQQTLKERYRPPTQPNRADQGSRKEPGKREGGKSGKE